MPETEPRTGMPPVDIDEDTFRERFFTHFYDPAFASSRHALEAAANIAWDAYNEGRKAPITRKAGESFSDPGYDLSVEWIAAHKSILEAQARHNDPASPSRILLINGSPRNEHTCPGEMSKSYRMIEEAQRVIAGYDGFVCDLLDLSRTTAEYGRQIHPCKGCFSTSPALCHWPCSCYPNHALGQIHDWMNEIYPMWVAAHGIMIVTPCHWYQAPSTLKLMMDRLVCADGGNPDPTSTHGKDAERAKQLELEGWPYPRHLNGRVFSIIAHGDSAGVETLRRSMTDWLTDMKMTPAGEIALVDTYIGYYKPYATSHADLDTDQALFEDIRNAVRALVEAVTRYRAGERPAGADLRDPKPK
jgi:multimeric flavodoxin WrbA